MDIRNIYFFEPYPIIAVVDQCGYILLFYLYYSDKFQYFDVIAKIKLNGSTDEYGISDLIRCLDKSIYVNSITLYSHLDLEDEFLIVLGTKNGCVLVYELHEYM